MCLQPWQMVRLHPFIPDLTPHPALPLHAVSLCDWQCNLPCDKIACKQELYSLIRCAAIKWVVVVHARRAKVAQGSASAPNLASKQQGEGECCTGIGTRGL